MLVLVTGGTGLIGSALCASLSRDGYQPVVLSRRPEAARVRLGHGVEVVGWTSGQPLPAGVLEGVEAVVNLAGENIGTGRWTAPGKSGS